MAPSFSARIISGYKDLSTRHPLLVLMGINGLLAATSDILAQNLEKSSGYRRMSPDGSPSPSISSHVYTPSSGVDPRRTIRFALYGMAMTPLVHTWFTLLDRSFPLPGLHSPNMGKTNGTSVALPGMWTQVLKRVAADQLIYAPFGLLVFFTAMGLFEGHDLNGVRRKIRDNFSHGLLANWAVWPAVQLINFRYVPLFYRVPFVGAVGILWNTFLSWLNHRSHPPTQEVLAV
ncbi:hypothetical protein BJ684DRAFT_11963 [Piptocephalis cylindrospora]|uniref:Uncharacterized protein n=1 Tax=Piptocephalis cylindrospora TaxID=1907219 RepID=A0A4P9Y0V1_9FUNG|nr:hypothetical protein BJ684DRAFT_11963 [Piptocephalis cylindrospora]|eukprot:RKP12122.1 hypothetical protein BJ684DRAFT_11963 [Piptocephalis cylindrospora]